MKYPHRRFARPLANLLALVLTSVVAVSLSSAQQPVPQPSQTNSSAKPAGSSPASDSVRGKAGNTVNQGSGAKDGSKPAGDILGGLSFSTDHGPINVTSDTLELDYKKSNVLYRGNVHASQGSFALASDTLKLIYGSNFHDIRQVIADGSVRVTQAGRWATGDRAVLNQVDHTVEMTGNPVIHDGQSQVAGDRIVLYLETQKFLVEKARAVIFPQKTESRDNNPLTDN